MTSIPKAIVREPLALWAVWHRATSGTSIQSDGDADQVAKRLYDLIASPWTLRPEQAPHVEEQKVQTSEMADDGLGEFFPVRAGIPFRFLPTYPDDDRAADRILESIETENARQNLVLLLIDQAMFEQDAKWSSIVRRLHLRCDEESDVRVSVAPVALRNGAWSAATDLWKVNHLRADDYPNEMADLRSLYPRILGHIAYVLNDNNPLRVFLSHAKGEGNGGKIAEALHKATQTRTDIHAFFDVSAIPPGEEFQTSIDEAIEESNVLVAILNEPYPHRRWTIHEVSKAQQYDKPIVAVDDTKRRLTWIPPALAGVPLVSWNGANVSSHLVLNSIVEAFLEQKLHTGRVRAIKEGLCDAGDDQPLPRTPTVLTVGQYEEKPAVYPDPPRSPIELDVMEEDGSQSHMTLSRYASRLGLKKMAYEKRVQESVRELLGDVRVGLSVSVPRRPVQGLHQTQLDDLAYTLASTVLQLGGTLAYGHDLRDESIAVTMSNIVRYYALDKLPRQVLEHHVAWPLMALWNLQPLDQRQRLENTSRLHRYLPVEVTDKNDPIWDFFVHWKTRSKIAETIQKNLNKAIERSSSSGNTQLQKLLEKAEKNATTLDGHAEHIHSYWASSLTRMREKLVGNCKATIAAGGPVTDFSGRLPGVLEEIYLAMKGDNAVYLIGGFGGITEMAWKLTQSNKDDKDPAFEHPFIEDKFQFNNDWQLKNNESHGPLVGKLKGELVKTWEEVRRVLREYDMGDDSGKSGRNGSTLEENRRLAQSRSTPEIVYLISRGLWNRFDSPLAGD